MLGLSFGIKGMAIAGALGLLIGSGSAGTLAYRYANNACKVQAEAVQVRAENARIKELETNLKVIAASAAQDAAQAQVDSAARTDMERKVNDLEAQIASRVCLTADDVDGLRRALFGEPK